MNNSFNTAKRSFALPIEDYKKIERLPIGLGGETECGDVKKAMFVLRLRLGSGVNGDRDLTGFFVCLGDD